MTTAAADGTKTPEQIAADAAAAAAAGDGQTPAQLAAKKTADDAAAATAAAAAAKKKTDDDAAAAAAAKKAPEKYDLKRPENSPIDDSDLKQLEKIARDNDMTNEEAQELLEGHHTELSARAAGYLADLTADKEYGGDKLAETQQRANAVIDRIRPAGHARRDSFLRFLNRAGANNHPDVVSFLADIGKAMKEDSPVRDGSSTTSSGKAPADVLYDSK